MTNKDEIIIYGATWCPDCRRAKQFLGEHRIPYQWIDITDNDEAIAYVEKANKGNRVIPTIVFPDESVLIEPSNNDLAEKLNISLEPDNDFYDVVIIGGGPAGLTAAIYTAREGLSTLLIDESGLGGQVAITQVLDNFPGFPEGVTGESFTERMEDQARRFEVEIVQGEEIVDIIQDGQYRLVRSVNDRDYVGRAVLVATGSHYKKMGIPGEMELVGYNVHFCATCDGAFYKDKDVLVIGGGNSGFEEGLFLAEKFAKSVTIVEFLPEVKASQILQNKVAERSDMKVITNHAVREIKINDNNEMDGVLIEDRATGETKTWHPDGVFVFIGLNPNSGFLPQTIKRDEWGFIQTDNTLQTSMEGVFAAGDVRTGSTKQAVSAAGEGAAAAMMIRQYLQKVGVAKSNTSIEREELSTSETQTETA